ncbi:MAG: hypothetical protein ORN21_02545, partial [Methylophilaceae bacterium]|nr:hypothetical protein [Methylophilaceae bacterium]
VNMNEAVLVTGTPQVALTIGTSTVQALYAGGTNSATLIFTYTILDGQTDANGIGVGINSINLNGGTITDLAGNVASLAHSAVLDNPNYIVDTTVPRVSTVTMGAVNSSNIAKFTTLDIGDKIKVTVNISEQIVINGTPTYTLQVGTIGSPPTPVFKTAVFDPASSSSTSLVFYYTIVAGDNAASGGITASTGALYAGGTLQDFAGNNLVLTTPTVPSNTLSVSTLGNDTTVPSVVSISLDSATGIRNNTLSVGDVLSIKVFMSEQTTVTGGSPQLTLTIGATPVSATYVSGSRSTVLLFTYAIMAGQVDTNGISIPANALVLNGATLTDINNNVAVITSGAVTDNAQFLVDTTIPSI